MVCLPPTVPLPLCGTRCADVRQFRLIEPKWQVQRINALVGEQAAQAKVPKIHENSEAHKSKEIGLPGDDSKWVDQLQPNGH